MSTKHKNQLTEISQLGEFVLIKKLTDSNKIKHQSTIKAVGDDAAVIERSNKETVVTTDLLVEGVHFNLSYTPLKHLGYKAVIVNLSDIYAMNATPKYITVSVAVSNRFSYEALVELYAGIYTACELYNIDLIGGDTSSSEKGMFISITAIGEGEKDKIVYRNTAKPNDLICVTGNLGAAYMGLQVLERENNIFKANPEIQPDLSDYDYILKRQLKPEARKEIIEILSENKIIPTSMIDISDGLSSEILHICTQSNVGCEIYEERLPIADETIKLADEIGILPSIAAMNGGEDYELLFTLSLKDYDKIKEIKEITVIGHMTEQKQGTNLVSKDGTTIPIIAQGWNAMEEHR
jgi:thiamine-monophosphate kinase